MSDIKVLLFYFPLFWLLVRLANFSDVYQSFVFIFYSSARAFLIFHTKSNAEQ